MSDSYPSDWNRRRREVYERDDYQCQNCGAKGGRKGDVELHAHHIVPKSKGGTHQVSNLKTICKQCHSAIHGDSMAPTTDTRPRTNESTTVYDASKFEKLGDSCPYCGHNSLSKYEQSISCDYCDERFSREWYGLKLKSHPSTPPFSNLCPNCAEQTTELVIEKNPYSLRLVCEGCDTVLKYDKKQALWRVRSGGNAIKDNPIHAKELKNMLEGETGKSLHSPHDSDSSKGDISITEVKCPACHSTQLSLSSSNPTLAICSECEAKMQNIWGRWKMVQGQCPHQGKELSISEWKELADHGNYL